MSIVSGRYVIFDEDDFNKVPVKTTHSIDIIGFVKAKEIDTIYTTTAIILSRKNRG